MDDWYIGLMGCAGLLELPLGVRALDRCVFFFFFFLNIYFCTDIDERGAVDFELPLWFGELLCCAGAQLGVAWHTAWKKGEASRYSSGLPSFDASSSLF